MECDFCHTKGDWKNILRDATISKTDGSDIILCDDCLNLYGNHEFDKLTDKVEKANKYVDKD